MTAPSSTSDSSVPRAPDIANSQHLIVVSNRLPITISKDAKGEYHFKMSSGGLVSALSGCKKSMTFTWIGWPGFYINPKDRAYVDKRLMEEYSCQAVYLDDDIADRHYNGFSNSILWPLFHYHPGEMNFDEENWWAYREANLKFAEVVLPHVKTGSMVWVQDYHLMLLPIMLRSLLDGPDKLDQVTFREVERVMEGIVPDDTIKPPDATNVRIGFFLHTPFPSSEIYRCAAVYPTFRASGKPKLTVRNLPGFFRSVGRSCSESCIAISLVSTPTTTPATSSLHALES
jgi:trehalose 6-phosphate synthase